MREGDVITITIKKNSANGNFYKIFEYDWLKYVGYDDEDLKKDELLLVFKAERSEKKKLPYIGFGRPVEQVKK